MIIDVNPDARQDARDYEVRNETNDGMKGLEQAKNNNEFRVIGGNINTFPITKAIRNKVKQEKLKQIVCSYYADVVSINEHNLNLSKVPYDQRPETIVEGWRASTIIKMGCMNASDDMYSRGGNGIISFDKVSKKLIEYGYDRKNLARWTWCTYKGKRGKNITVFSCYRPDDQQITYKEQLAYLAREGQLEIDNYDHNKAWYNDLKDEVAIKRNKGDEVIIMGDFNENLEDKKSRILELMESLGMSNPLLERYGTPGATHIRGSECIDGVFVSDGLKVTKGGYIPFEWSPGDHRWMWMDISVKDIWEEGSRDIRKVNRKATSKIPSIKKEFNDILNRRLKNQNMEEKVKKLETIIENEVSDHSTFNRLYEHLDESFRRSVRHADNKCKKIRKGPIPFSDQTRRILGEYTLLKLILLRHRMKKSKKRPSMISIKRLSKKIKSKIPLHYASESDILERCKLNAKEYKDLKENSNEYRNTYLGNLASELSEIDGKDIAWHLQQLKNREANKRLWRCIKRYENRGRNGGVDKVDIETEDGLKTMTDKYTIINEIIKANGAKRIQANNTPFQQEPLRSTSVM